MKILIIGITIFASIIVLAEALPLQDAKQLQLEKLQQLQEEKARQNGGLLVKPDSQKGEIVYINCQNAADEKWLSDNADYICKRTRFRISVKKGTFDFAKPEIQGDLSLFVIDDSSMPSLLVAPENRWAMINVAPLKSDKGKFFEMRVRKELTRAFTHLCGGTGTQASKCLVGAVIGLNMLDSFESDELPPEVVSRFLRAMPNLGIKPFLYTSYASACKQGWAPAPTNDVQKAIWEKVHSIPDKPMKITFDPATQKGKVTK